MSNRGRINEYKYYGKDPQEMRRQRAEVSTNLRKIKREEVLNKRRNIDFDALAADESLGTNSNIKAQLEDLVERAMSPDPVVRLDAVKATRKLLSADQRPPINDVISSPMFAILIEALKLDGEAPLQFEAAWALTNIASGDSHQTQAVVRGGAVEHFVRLLKSPQMSVCEQAVWALGNIIGDGAECREYVVRHGFIDLLLAFVNPNTGLPFLRNVTWVMVNLCRNKDKPLPSLKLIGQLTPALLKLIHHTDHNILVDTVWAVSYITDMGSPYLQHVIDCGIVPYIIPLLHHRELKVVASALRAVGNIATGSHEQTQVVVDNGVLNYIPSLLEHPKERIKKEATWLLSNITAGTETQLSAVIEAGVIPKVIYFLENSEIQTKKEAAWCISNMAVSGNHEQVRYLLQLNATIPLCNLLRCDNAEIIRVSLDAINKLLNHCTPAELKELTLAIEETKGLEAIEKLQTHQSKDIYKTAYEILDAYFPEEDAGGQNSDIEADESGEIKGEEDDDEDDDEGTANSRAHSTMNDENSNDRGDDGDESPHMSGLDETTGSAPFKF
ncbi:hypothetical protein ACOME3_010059 [Neoechinorhynchus agilis]